MYPRWSCSAVLIVHFRPLSLADLSEGQRGRCGIADAGQGRMGWSRIDQPSSHVPICGPCMRPLPSRPHHATPWRAQLECMATHSIAREPIPKPRSGTAPTVGAVKPVVAETIVLNHKSVRFLSQLM